MGALATFAGVAVLFFQEKYVTGGLLALFALILLGYVLQEFLREPISLIACEFHMQILDESAHKSLVQKKKDLFVRERNITTLVDRHLSSPGKLESPSSNIGDEVLIVDEGGTKSLYTNFRTPLPVGKQIQHVLEFVVWDSFPEKTESFSYLVVNRQKVFKLILEFPHNRPPRAPRAYCLYKERSTELDFLAVNRGGLQLTLTVKKPKVGSRYLVEWRW